jgi:predicted neuraminidase
VNFNNICFLDNQEFKTCHCPHLIHDNEKKLYLVFYGGEYEGVNGCGIWMSEYDLNSLYWKPAWCIAVNPNQCFQNPIIHLENKILYLFYTSQPGNGIDICQINSHIERKISLDYGKTWSNPEIVIPKGTGCYLRHHVLVEHNKDNKDNNNTVWLLPVYYTPTVNLKEPNQLDNNQYSALLESSDKGITWNTRSIIPNSNNSNGIQGSMRYIPQTNDIIGVFRNRHYNAIKTTISHDNGHTIEPLKEIDETLISNDSGLSMIPLNDKSYAIFYNDVSNQSKEKRNNITMSVIDINKNKIIETKRILDHKILGLEKPQRISYPSTVMVNGKIHCCYAFKRKTIGHITI